MRNEKEFFWQNKNLFFGEERRVFGANFGAPTTTSIDQVGGGGTETPKILATEVTDKWVHDVRISMRADADKYVRENINSLFSLPNQESSNDSFDYLSDETDDGNYFAPTLSKKMYGAKKAMETEYKKGVEHIVNTYTHKLEQNYENGLFDTETEVRKLRSALDKDINQWKANVKTTAPGLRDSVQVAEQKEEVRIQKEKSEKETRKNDFRNYRKLERRSKERWGDLGLRSEAQLSGATKTDAMVAVGKVSEKNEDSHYHPQGVFEAFEKSDVYEEIREKVVARYPQNEQGVIRDYLNSEKTKIENRYYGIVVREANNSLDDEGLSRFFKRIFYKPKAVATRFLDAEAAEFIKDKEWADLQNKYPDMFRKSSATTAPAVSGSSGRPKTGKPRKKPPPKPNEETVAVIDNATKAVGLSSSVELADNKLTLKLEDLPPQEFIKTKEAIEYLNKHLAIKEGEIDAAKKHLGKILDGDSGKEEAAKLLARKYQISEDGNEVIFKTLGGSNVDPNEIEGYLKKMGATVGKNDKFKISDEVAQKMKKANKGVDGLMKFMKTDFVKNMSMAEFGEWFKFIIDFLRSLFDGDMDALDDWEEKKEAKLLKKHFDKNGEKDGSDGEKIFSVKNSSKDEEKLEKLKGDTDSAKKTRKYLAAELLGKKVGDIDSTTYKDGKLIVKEKEEEDEKAALPGSTPSAAEKHETFEERAEEYLKRLEKEATKKLTIFTGLSQIHLKKNDDNSYLIGIPKNNRADWTKYSTRREAKTALVKILKEGEAKNPPAAPVPMRVPLEQKSGLEDSKKLAEEYISKADAEPNTTIDIPEVSATILKGFNNHYLIKIFNENNQLPLQEKFSSRKDAVVKLAELMSSQKQVDKQAIFPEQINQNIAQAKSIIDGIPQSQDFYEGKIDKWYAKQIPITNTPSRSRIYAGVITKTKDGKTKGETYINILKPDGSILRKDFAPHEFEQFQKEVEALNTAVNGNKINDYITNAQPREPQRTPEEEEKLNEYIKAADDFIHLIEIESLPNSKDINSMTFGGVYFGKKFSYGQDSSVSFLVIAQGAKFPRGSMLASFLINGTRHIETFSYEQGLEPFEDYVKKVQKAFAERARRKQEIEKTSYSEKNYMAIDNSNGKKIFGDMYGARYKYGDTDCFTGIRKIDIQAVTEQGIDLAGLEIFQTYHKTEKNKPLFNFSSYFKTYRESKNLPEITTQSFADIKQELSKKPGFYLIAFRDEVGGDGQHGGILEVTDDERMLYTHAATNVIENDNKKYLLGQSDEMRLQTPIIGLLGENYSSLSEKQQGKVREEKKAAFNAIRTKHNMARPLKSANGIYSRKPLDEQKDMLVSFGGKEVNFGKTEITAGSVVTVDLERYLETNPGFAKQMYVQGLGDKQDVTSDSLADGSPGQAISPAATPTATPTATLTTPQEAKALLQAEAPPQKINALKNILKSEKQSFENAGYRIDISDVDKGAIFTIGEGSSEDNEYTVSHTVTIYTKKVGSYNVGNIYLDQDGTGDVIFSGSPAQLVETIKSDLVVSTTTKNQDLTTHPLDSFLIATSKSFSGILDSSKTAVQNIDFVDGERVTIKHNTADDTYTFSFGKIDRNKSNIEAVEVIRTTSLSKDDAIAKLREITRNDDLKCMGSICLFLTEEKREKFEAYMSQGEGGASSGAKSLGKIPGGFETLTNSNIDTFISNSKPGLVMLSGNPCKFCDKMKKYLKENLPDARIGILEDRLDTNTKTAQLFGITDKYGTPIWGVVQNGAFVQGTQKRSGWLPNQETAYDQYFSSLGVDINKRVQQATGRFEVLRDKIEERRENFLNSNFPDFNKVEILDREIHITTSHGLQKFRDTEGAFDEIEDPNDAKRIFSLWEGEIVLEKIQ